MTCLLQDQHLHNFFQHCQNMEMSEQASEGELVKYLKVLKDSFICNALRKLQLTLLFMDCQIHLSIVPKCCSLLLIISCMWHYSCFVC